jgi:UDP-glucose 4-epimerase
MSRILVTGALGHIGSAFIHSLRQGEFEEVHLMDNLLTQRYSSIFHLPPGIAFYFHEADILTCDLGKYLSGIDAVIHLAAITDAAGSFDKKDQIEEVNYKGVERIARACALRGCRFFFPSTTSVYGSQASLVDENCPEAELQPQSPYAESKIKAEKLLASLRGDGLKSITCRLGTIFGVSIGMRFHTAVNKFCWQAVMGQPLTVWETAYEQKRPYLELGDAVRVIKFILEQDLFDGGTYNIVTQNCTVKDIVEAIRQEVPLLKVEFVKNKIMNQLSYEVANKKFCSCGFSFSGKIDQGIKQTIQQFDGIVNACHPERSEGSQ